MTLYKYDTSTGTWDTGTAMANGTSYKVSVSNGWGRTTIPLSTLKLKVGDTVGVIYSPGPPPTNRGLRTSHPINLGGVRLGGWERRHRRHQGQSLRDSGYTNI